MAPVPARNWADVEGPFRARRMLQRTSNCIPLAWADYVKVLNCYESLDTLADFAEGDLDSDIPDGLLGKFRIHSTRFVKFRIHLTRPDQRQMNDNWSGLPCHSLYHKIHLDRHNHEHPCVGLLRYFWCTWSSRRLHIDGLPELAASDFDGA